MLGFFAWIMPLSVAISTFGSANGTIFAAGRWVGGNTRKIPFLNPKVPSTVFGASRPDGRLCYVASREGHLLDILSFVHKDNLTPTPALLFNALIANIMILQVRSTQFYKPRNVVDQSRNYCD